MPGRPYKKPKRTQAGMRIKIDTSEGLTALSMKYKEEIGSFLARFIDLAYEHGIIDNFLAGNKEVQTDKLLAEVNSIVVSLTSDTANFHDVQEEKIRVLTEKLLLLISQFDTLKS